MLGLVEEYFHEARERRKELEKRPDDVIDILKMGGQKARERAGAVVERVREAAGLVTTYEE